MSFFTQLTLDHIFIHWGLCTFLLFFDGYTQNEWRKYKLQYPHIPDTWYNIFTQVLFNQIFITIPCLYLYCLFCAPDSIDTLLALENLYRLPLTFLYEEILFYTTHRLLHHPYLYQKIHKIHHRWTAPMAIAATYAHPLEHAVSNVLPIVFSAYLAGLGQVTTRLWHAVALINTLFFSHGGYSLPYVRNMHNKHHTDFDCNYGVIGLLDYLCGTLR